MRHVSSIYLAFICCLGLLLGAEHAAIAKQSSGTPEGMGPAFWQVTTWALTSNISKERLITDVDNMASRYAHVEIVGTGDFADALAEALRGRIGNEHIDRVSTAQSADELRSVAMAHRADLVLRVTDTPPKPMVTDEQSFIAMDDLHQITESIHSGLWALRSAEGLLKDPRFVTDPLFKQNVGELHKLFGDLTSRQATGILERGEKLLNSTNWMLGGAKDMLAISNGEFVLVKSETVNNAISWLTDKVTDKLLDRLGSDGAQRLYQKLWSNNPLVPKAGFTALGSSLSELAAGLRIQMTEGHGHWTVDAVDHYANALVATTSMAAAMLLTDGNIKVSKNISDFAVSVAQTTRTLSWQAYQAVAFKPEELFEHWQAQVVVDAKAGRTPMTWSDFATQHNTSPDSLSHDHKYQDVARDTYNSALRMAQAESARATEDITRMFARSTTPSVSGVSTNTPLLTRPSPVTGAAHAIGLTPFRSPVPTLQELNSAPQDWKLTAQDHPKPTSNIGGVMLSNIAGVPGADGQVYASDGGFSLVVNGTNAAISREDFARFVTALWATNYCRQAPGISIDPIAPNVDKHLVRYIGQVINSDLGRVMREADYFMKKVVLGMERPHIKGFRPLDQIMADRRELDLAYRRFWWVNENMQFREGGGMLLYAGGAMKLRTELLSADTPGQKIQADQDFADFWTDHYADIAKQYPIYDELFEYAKLVAIGRYLKTQGVPLLWFLLANRDLVLTEDSKGTVQELALKSTRIPGLELKGGVDLSTKGHYVADADALAAMRTAISRNLPSNPNAGSQPSPVVTHEPSTPAPSIAYRAVPQESLTCGVDFRGLRYQTDVAYRMDGEPALELVRYFDGHKNNHGMFGNGWDMLLPYRVNLSDERRTVKVGDQEIVGPALATVVDLLGGEIETLEFDPARYGNLGYVPPVGSGTKTIGVFVTNAGAVANADEHGVAAYRLADKLGNEFTFDQRGLMTGMILGQEHRLTYTYARNDTHTIVRPSVTIQPVPGSDTVTVGPFELPGKLKLTDKDGLTGLVLVAQPDGRYLPEPRSTTSVRGGLFATDGKFRMVDDLGNEVVFAPEGAVESISFSGQTNVVQSMRYERLDPAPGGIVAKPGQEVAFEFSVDLTGAVRVGRAIVTCNAPKGKTVLLYQYDSSGCLIGVTHEDLN